MPHIDLNCDLGESFGAYTIGMDEKVIPFITSANVACGFHAGDPLVMQRTVALCKQSGAAAGADPTRKNTMLMVHSTNTPARLAHRVLAGAFFLGLPKRRCISSSPRR